jgi:hypothetical protein
MKLQALPPIKYKGHNIFQGSRSYQTGSKKFKTRGKAEKYIDRVLHIESKKFSQN